MGVVCLCVTSSNSCRGGCGESEHFAALTPRGAESHTFILIHETFKHKLQHTI